VRARQNFVLRRARRWYALLRGRLRKGLKSSSCALPNEFPNVHIFMKYLPSCFTLAYPLPCIFFQYAISNRIEVSLNANGALFLIHPFRVLAAPLAFVMFTAALTRQGLHMG